SPGLTKGTLDKPIISTRLDLDAGILTRLTTV
ncbi:MAG: hypothetical protein ACI9BG_000787, partial [Parasphingorhabdus sp.]